MGSFNVLAIRAYEDMPGDTYLYPGLSDVEGEQFAVEPADGEIIGMLWLSGVSVHEPGRGVSKRMAAASPSLAAGSSVVRTPARTAAYVSDCRIMLACEKYERGNTWVGAGPGAAIAAAATVVSAAKAARRRRGKVLVGQVRCEWIKRIGASPPYKGRHLLAVVALEYTDAGITKSVHLHLPRGGVEPVVLAQDIAPAHSRFPCPTEPRNACGQAREP